MLYLKRGGFTAEDICQAQHAHAKAMSFDATHRPGVTVDTADLQRLPQDLPRSVLLSRARRPISAAGGGKEPQRRRRRA